jgi:phage gp36-like protein
MSYSTPTSVRTALTAGGVITDTTSAASLSDPDIQDKITEADALIDGYLTARYAIPITVTVPPLLMMLSRDIAALYATLTYLGSIPLQPTHPVQLKATQALAMLEKIRTGDIMLPLPGAGSEQRSDNPWVENRYDGTMFSLGDFDLAPVWW